MWGDGGCRVGGGRCDNSFAFWVDFRLAWNWKLGASSSINMYLCSGIFIQEPWFPPFLSYLVSWSTSLATPPRTGRRRPTSEGTLPRGRRVILGVDTLLRFSAHNNNNNNNNNYRFRVPHQVCLAGSRSKTLFATKHAC